MGPVMVDGRPLPQETVGVLEATDPASRDPAGWRRRLAEDGYLYLPGVLDREAVIAARREVTQRLAETEEIAAPAEAGIATGTSRRAEAAPDANVFWRSVSEGPALRHVTHGRRLRALFGDLLAEAAVPFDFLWLRATPVGRASPLHFYHVYMNRGSRRVLSAWVPLGDVPICDGPLLVVEESHRFRELIARFRGQDVDRDPSRPGDIGEAARDIARRYGARLLTADFRAGDLVIFGMFLLHGSADNVSLVNRVRLSCDLRYQPAADPRDDRWFGDPPPGHGGGSYGALSSARPLTAPPLRR